MQWAVGIHEDAGDSHVLEVIPDLHAGPAHGRYQGREASDPPEASDHMPRDLIY